jgi:hypothetical protein
VVRWSESEAFSTDERAERRLRIDLSDQLLERAHSSNGPVSGDVEAFSKRRAERALVRQWSGAGSSTSLRDEVDRLRQLVGEAIKALHAAGLAPAAEYLRHELGEPDGADRQWRT